MIGSGLAIGLAAPDAIAQVAPSHIPGQSREELDPASRTPAVQPRLVDPGAAIQAQDCPFAGKGNITLTRVDVRGATLVSAADLQAAVSDLVGRPSDLAILCEARSRVEALYRRRGETIIRVDLPEQRISGGQLTLQVTEGRVASTSIRNAEAQGPSAARAADYLGELEDGSATRWGELERAFLLTQEIPGADVNFSVRPVRTIGPNALEAVATFRPRRLVDVTVDAHNFGAALVGRETGSVRIDLNSLTSLAERTSILVAASRTGRQRVFQLLEEVRPGSSGLTLNADVAYARNEPGGALEVLDIEGSSLVARLAARYPLVRRRNRAVDLTGRIELIDQDNVLGFLEEVGGPPVLLFREKLRVGSARLSGRWARAGAASLGGGASIELRQGLPALGASDSSDPLLSRHDARPDFTLVRGQAAARVAFPSALAPWASATLLGQWAGSGLPAYEEYQIGNYTVGRGYDPGSVSGDHGLGVQLEGGVQLAMRGADRLFGAAPAVNLFAFLDAARVWNRDPQAFDSTVSSVGAGMRMRWPLTEFAISYAVPRSEPFPGAGEPGSRILASLSRSFSIK